MGRDDLNSKLQDTSHILLGMSEIHYC